jgi:two-component system sensor histidine kinase RstB
LIALFARLVVVLSSAILLTLLLAWLLIDGSPQDTAHDLLRGHAEYVAHSIAETPPVERSDKAEEWSQTLGYGVVLEEAAGAVKTRAERRSGKLFIVARVPENPGQVVLGPLPFGYSTSLATIAVSAILVSCLIAFFVSWAVHKRIRGLERVAERMHRGDFTARAERDESDVLDGIGSSLNQLADRVGELLHDERDLLRTVAHEVRTPISRMHFRVESISRKAKGDSPKEAAGLVSDLDQVDKLFAELLTYVGFDEFHQDRPELQTTTIDVLEAVSRVAHEVTSVNEEVEVEINGDEGARVEANQKLFDRATSNLVLNAMAYGGSKIYIDIRVFEKECVVDVQDTGAGIPEEDRPKVIKPFVRLAKKKTKGTGLGLAIVSRIMRLHGGKLHIVDAPQGGASVQLAWKNAEPNTRSRRGLGRPRPP